MPSWIVICKKKNTKNNNEDRAQESGQFLQTFGWWDAG